MTRDAPTFRDDRLRKSRIHGFRELRDEYRTSAKAVLSPRVHVGSFGGDESPGQTAMRDDDLPDLTYDEKRRLTDLELIRRADRDGEAFEILASGRIKHVYLEIKEWCDSDAEADAAYREISDATIHTAVEYSRHLKPGQVGFEPPDWFGQVALIALYTWIERNGRCPRPRRPPPRSGPLPRSDCGGWRRGVWPASTSTAWRSRVTARSSNM